MISLFHSFPIGVTLLAMVPILLLPVVALRYAVDRIGVR